MNWWRSISKQKQQQIVLTVLMVLIGVAGTWVFFAGRQLSSAQKNRAKILVLEAQLADATKAAEQTAKNLPMREKLQAFVDAQESVMVAGDSFAWVVREITLLAEQHPVRDVSLRSGNRIPHSRKSRYECYLTRIEFSGSYDQIGSFLRDLENKFPTGEVRTLELTGGSAGGNQLHAMVDLALLIRPKATTVDKTEGKSQPS